MMCLKSEHCKCYQERLSNRNASLNAISTINTLMITPDILKKNKLQYVYSYFIFCMCRLLDRLISSCIREQVVSKDSL